MIFLQKRLLHSCLDGGGGNGGFRVFRQFPQRSLSEVRCVGAIGFFVWSWVSTPLEYYSVSHVFRVKFYVKVAFTEKQSKVVRRSIFQLERFSVDFRQKSKRFIALFKRGPPRRGGGYSLKRSEKLFCWRYFWDSTITHMQIFHLHVNIIINFS